MQLKILMKQVESLRVLPVCGFVQNLIKEYVYNILLLIKKTGYKLQPVIKRFLKYASKFNNI